MKILLIFACLLYPILVPAQSNNPAILLNSEQIRYLDSSLVNFFIGSLSKDNKNSEILIKKRNYYVEIFNSGFINSNNQYVEIKISNETADNFNDEDLDELEQLKNDVTENLINHFQTYIILAKGLKEIKEKNNTTEIIFHKKYSMAVLYKCANSFGINMKILKLK